MPVKKRTKRSRYRGTHTHGRGAKKKARGSGHRGGIGNAGTGKRADQKKTKILKKKGGKYFGKVIPKAAPERKELKVISLENISGNINSFVKKGIAKKSGDSYELDLKGYKIIGNDKIDFKVKINATGASKGAIDAVSKARGEIIIEVKKKVGINKKKDEQNR